jgi:hypothetical protein
MAMPETPPARYRWAWFFVVLGVLTSCGIGANVWYNWQQQLTPEELSAAQKLWDEKGPRDYQLEYEIKRETNPDLAGAAPQTYTVSVHDRKVVVVTTADGRPLKTADYDFDSMDSLFEIIDQQLHSDADPAKPLPFVIARFDEQDGHVLRYVHSVARTRERLEVRVKLTPEIGRRD